MSGDDKEGSYCSVCGGISPGKVKTRCISVNGKEIGIDKLDSIISQVRAMNLADEQTIVEELLKRTREHNYVPTSRAKDYGEALLQEYRGGE